MKMDILLPVLNQPELTQQTMDKLRALQKNYNRFIIVDNGSSPPVSRWIKNLHPQDLIIRHDKNKGLPKAINRALIIANEDGVDYVFATHTDVVMFEQDWDQKTMDAINEAGRVGVAGYFGALGIGSPDLYQTPYQMQQLARRYTLAGSRCKLSPQVHGHSQFHESWKPCAVLDGFSLIINSKLRLWEGTGIHHCYDHQICLQSINEGYRNIVVNMDVDHLGGQTDVNEDWTRGTGKTKQQVHAESHVPFYEYWRPGKNNISLPYMI